MVSIAVNRAPLQPNFMIPVENPSATGDERYGHVPGAEVMDIYVSHAISGPITSVALASATVHVFGTASTEIQLTDLPQNAETVTLRFTPGVGEIQTLTLPASIKWKNGIPFDITTGTLTEVMITFSGGGNGIAYALGRVPSRQDVVDAIASGSIEVNTGDVIKTLEGMEFRKSPGATVISDMPDFIPHGEVKWRHFGEMSSSGQAISNALQFAGTVGQALIIRENIAVSDQTILYTTSDLTLIIERGYTIKADFVSAPTYLINFNGQTNPSLVGGGEINANDGNVQFNVFTAGSQGVIMLDVYVTEWRYGVTCESTADIALGEVRGRIRVGVQATALVAYPVWVNHKASVAGPLTGPVDLDVYFDELVPGAFVLFGSGGGRPCADAVSLHGVSGGRCRVWGRNGGEAAFTAARGSHNLQIEGALSGADAHGLIIGSGNYMIGVDSSAPFTIGDTVEADISGVVVSGVVEGVNVAGRVAIRQITGNANFEVGATLTNITTPGTATITETFITRDNHASGMLIYNNGLDVTATGTAYSGVYLQRSLRTTLSGIRSRGNPKDLIATQATFTQNGCDWERSGIDAVELQGGAAEITGRGVRINYYGQNVYLEMRSDGRILFGPTRPTTPSSSTTNSAANRGVAINTVGQIDANGNNGVAFYLGRSGSATGMLGDIIELRRLGVRVGGIGTDGTEDPQFTVAELTVAPMDTKTYKRVICTDGAAGAPCPAWNNGTGWINMIDGNPISAT